MAQSTTETLKRDVFKTEELVAKAITAISVHISEAERNAHTVDPQLEKDLKEARRKLQEGAKIIDKWTKRYGF